MEEITSCRICRSKKIRPFFDLGKHPLANSLLEKANQKEKLYPLSLSWCPNCSLVQLNQTVDPEVLFSNYVWVTGTSPSTRKYAQKFFQEVISRLFPERLPVSVPGTETGGLKVMEVGSNDGTFLLPFIRAGFQVLGIDPARNIVQEANANGIPTKAWFFDIKNAKRLLKEFGSANVVIARNVLPHVADTRGFVKGLSACLTNKGLLVIEVHYAGKILEDLHYDSIYHEHLCYFSLKTLERLLIDFGFYVFDISESPISGGSIVVYAKKEKNKESAKVRQYRTEESKNKANGFSGWQNFAREAFKHRQKLLEVMMRRGKRGPVVGYGASARSSTLLNFCQINSDHILAIADDNPLKQGRYTPGSHILIEAAPKVMKPKPELVFLLAWNFADSLIEILKDKFGYQGDCLIPLPIQPRLVKI